ncbi:MAG: hypothetical protein ACLTJG_22060 [[Clostridium] innocuum]
MQNPGIIRNRLKISCSENAVIFQQITGIRQLSAYLGFTEGVTYRTLKELPTHTALR